MPYYKVKSGDCISSIAFKHNLLPDTVWLATENQELRALREDPNVLMEGDRVFVRAKEAKSVDGATDTRHQFRRRGVPSKLQIQFFDEDDKPIANAGYRLDLGGMMIEKTTDGEGWLRVAIPPDLARARLIFDSGEEHVLHLGHLHPLETVEGLHDRLRNLGYPWGEDAYDELGPGTLAAVRVYRADKGMTIPEALTDEVLSETREQLKKEHYT